MKTIIINSSNYVSGTNNTYRYTFPQPTTFQDGNKIGYSQASIYNSTFNITSARGNNTFSIIWNDNTTSITYNATISDGYYSVSDLNFFLQSFCITNYLYVTDANGDNVYFLELTVNAPRYSVQLNSYALPTSATATTLGYTIPSSATWAFPSTAKTPQIVISSSLGNIIGFAAATYPSSVLSTTQSFLSTKSPVVSPVDSYIFTCNLINSPYSIPNNVFFSLPLTAALGELVVQTPAQIVFNNIAPNQYTTIEIKLFDQLFNTLILNDYALVLTLVIVEKDEV